MTVAATFWGLAGKFPMNSTKINQAASTFGGIYFLLSYEYEIETIRRGIYWTDRPTHAIS